MNYSDKIREELMTLMNMHQGRDPMHDGNFRKAMDDWFLSKHTEYVNKLREEIEKRMTENNKESLTDKFKNGAYWEDHAILELLTKE